MFICLIVPWRYRIGRCSNSVFVLGFCGSIENGKMGPLLYHVSMYLHIFHNIVCECGDCEASDICPLI